MIVPLLIDEDLVHRESKWYVQTGKCGAGNWTHLVRSQGWSYISRHTQNTCSASVFKIGSSPAIANPEIFSLFFGIYALHSGVVFPCDPFPFLQSGLKVGPGVPWAASSLGSGPSSWKSGPVEQPMNRQLQAWGQATCPDGRGLWKPPQSSGSIQVSQQWLQPSPRAGLEAQDGHLWETCIESPARVFGKWAPGWPRLFIWPYLIVNRYPENFRL